MFLVPALLGGGCAVALTAAALSRDFDRGLLAWLHLTMFVGLMACWRLDQVWLFPAFDWTIGMVTLLMWHGRPRERAFRNTAIVILVRLALHAANSVSGGAYQILYFHALNATFAALLWLVIDWRGHGLGIRGWVLHRFRRVLRAGVPKHPAYLER